MGLIDEACWSLRTQLTPYRGGLEAMMAALVSCFEQGGNLLVCGNGGSASDSEHLAGELMKRYVRPRPLDARRRECIEAAVPEPWANVLCNRLEGALPVWSLVHQSALITAIGNDVGYDMVFAQQVFGYGHTGDVLLAISTSGHSRNVVLAAWTAKALGMRVLALTGGTGGDLVDCADVAVCIAQVETARIQEHHLAIYHLLSEALERHFFSPSDGQ